MVVLMADRKAGSMVDLLVEQMVGEKVGWKVESKAVLMVEMKVD